MRFLIYGAGVIGSIYAACLSRNGYEVSVVVSSVGGGQAPAI